MYLKFWATWCVPCRQQMPHFEHAYETAGSDLAGSQARWLGVALGLWAAPEELREYQQKNQIRIPLTLDDSGALFRAFSVSQVPTVLIVDATGKITQRIDSGNLQMLREALTGL